MDSVYLYDRWYGHIPSAGWDEVTSQTEWVCDHWDQPDEGIGETRGGWSLRLKAFAVRLAIANRAHARRRR